MSAEEHSAIIAPEILNETLNQPLPTGHILVALDASPHSAAALMAAAEVAFALKLELYGLYVEDVNLLHLCGLPFGLEIGSFTGNPRRLEQVRMERDLCIQATLLRKIMADVAGRQRRVGAVGQGLGQPAVGGGGHGDGQPVRHGVGGPGRCGGPPLALSALSPCFESICQVMPRFCG